MSQSDTTVSTRFSLLPGSITRFFLLLIVVLLVMMGVMVQSAVNTWLKDKSYQIVDITHAIHKRVDTWRYVTWQIYDNIAASTSSPGAEGLQETRLKQDVYYLEKPRRKTEALIFGSHDSSTLEMTQRISTYLDTLWGAENVPWSMYYLNGQDNSLILISTLPLKDLTSGFKESTIGNIVDSRRAEMLQQANALDERESFSSLRRLAWQNGHYFTLRTTFNQPGHLATVVAFDLPINDLIPPGMPLDSFYLEPDATSTTEHLNEKESPDSVSINFNNSKIEISSALNSTDMRLVWQVPFGSLLLDTLQSILLPLLLNIALLALALFGYTTFRHLPARSTEVACDQPDRCALDSPLRALGGKAIADDQNIRLQEELYHGRSAKRVNDFAENELKPVLEYMRGAGLTMADVEEYLHARHAREANAVIAAREPSMPDGGSGMTNAAADAYMKALPADQRAKLEKAAEGVDAIIAGTRDLYVAYGLESQSVTDGWKRQFKHYVPLMREDKDGGMGIGQGFSIKGKEVKGRTGSTRKVVDIFANIAMQRERVIVRGEKNRVAQAAVGLAEANPNDDFWTVDEVPTTRVHDPKTNTVVEQADTMFKQRENVLVAKFVQPDGSVIERAVVFDPDNERAVRMAGTSESTARQ